MNVSKKVTRILFDESMSYRWMVFDRVMADEPPSLELYRRMKALLDEIERWARLYAKTCGLSLRGDKIDFHFACLQGSRQRVAKLESALLASLRPEGSA